MKLADVIAAYRHRPFRPLVLRTDSGEEHPLNHPEAMSTSDDGELVGVILANNDFVLIEVASIRQIVAKPSRPRKPRAE